MVIKNSKGITLIEMMIMTVIVAILMMVLIPAIQENQARGNTQLQSGIYCLEGQQGYYTARDGQFQLNTGRDISVDPADLENCSGY